MALETKESDEQVHFPRNIVITQASPASAWKDNDLNERHDRTTGRGTPALLGQTRTRHPTEPSRKVWA